MHLVPEALQTDHMATHMTQHIPPPQYSFARHCKLLPNLAGPKRPDSSTSAAVLMAVALQVQVQMPLNSM